MANDINIKATFNGKQALDGILKLEKSFGTLKKAVIAVFASKMVKEAAQFGKNVSLMADRTGMSITKLESLKNTFISAGAGAKGFEQTINHINKGLLGLNRGEGQFAAALAPMGISPFGQDARGILLEIADWAKTQKDIGRSDAEIIDYLESRLGISPEYAQSLINGREYILAEEARLANKIGTPSEENVKNLAELNRSLAELGKAWDNAKVSAIGTLAPVLTDVFDGLARVLGLFTEFPELGAAALAAAASIGTLKIVLTGISLLGGAGSVVGAGTGAAAVGAGTTLLAGALITVIIDSIWECIDMIQSGKINGVLGKMWDVFYDGVESVLNWISSGTTAFLQKVEKTNTDFWNNYNAGSMSYPDFARKLVSIPDVPVVYDTNDLMMSLMPGNLGSGETPVRPSNIEVHMEGSTFTGIENAEDVGSAVGNSMTSMVSATG